MIRKLTIAAAFVVLPTLTAVGLRAQKVPYGTGSWDSETLGNHRAVLGVSAAAEVVQARIPWRRRDRAPEKKDIILVDGSTGARVANVLAVDVNRSYGTILFEAKNPGTYYAYYMPYRTKGRNYPQVTYLPPEDTAEAVWKSRALSPDAKPVPADVIELQSIDEFDSFYPMEVIAAPGEVKKLLAQHAGSRFLLFSEDRTRSIRMTDDLPLKWIEEGPGRELTGEALVGEFYSFQIGLYASASDIRDVDVRFSDLVSGDGRTIAASAMKCINTGGIDWDGRKFRKKIEVEQGHVQALWCGVQIPEDAAAGTYRGRVTVEPAGMPAQSIPVAITVAPESIADAGDDEPWRLSRLRWLDSQLAVDDGIVRPFVPVRVARGGIEILGRRLTPGPSGLPARIESFFSPEVTRIEKSAKPLLAAPMTLVAEDASGRRLQWKFRPIEFTKRKEGIVEWHATGTSGALRMDVAAAMEFDGFVRYRITLSAGEPFDVRDVRLEIPFLEEAVPYMMGLGRKGGRRPESYDWTWDVKKNQDGAWLGDADRGLQFSLRAENYSRPLNTNFYQSKPLHMPPSWFNDGKGGIHIRESGDATLLVSCTSGGRTLRPGQELHFDFNLLLTPFKPLDTQAQWSTRFFHAFEPVDDVIRAGANIINVHHGNDANPYINYPFLHQKEMKAYIDEAHRKNLRVKIYYTIRELSNRAPELFALRSLGTEIFSPGPGGGFSWLQEHLGGNYIAAWFVPRYKDAAIINSGMSRWHNYYIEGLAWLVKKMKIDGLYIDDVAYDRTTMKRVRKVLDRGRPAAFIDLHSANQYNPRDGFANSANLYMEHFPYLNRLWFGEYFDPDSPPDFWLVEMSGIPYGLMGEMLQNGGNRWRGMIYGMTSRMPWNGNDPSPVWKVWDDFGIDKSDMIGYWSPRCPVRTGNPDVPATAYVRAGEKALISIASWAEGDTQVKLSIDWRALGLDPACAVLRAPEVRDFQPAASFRPGEAIAVPKGKGWLLVASPANEIPIQGAK